MTSDDNDSHPKQKPRPSPRNGSQRQVPEKTGIAPRQVAARLLAAVVDRRVSLDGMLDAENGNPGYRALNEADRALVRAILNTSLRHLPRIQAIIDSLVESPLPDGARSLYHILVVAAAQILYLEVPDHSAVDLAVEQARSDPRSRRFAGLVNAVLRRLAREKVPHLTATHAVPVIPAWFFDRLSEVYGPERAARISESQLEPVAIDLTVKADPQGWARRLGGRLLPTGSVRLPAFAGRVPDLEGFADGAWWVQDAAASIPARLFPDLAGRRVADLCAAPGGKTAQLAQAGAVVTALDQSANRLKRLEGNLARLGLAATTIATNLLDFKPAEAFDAVLLDAPCSSTGTIRRHPDVLWTKGPADIDKLAALQERLLRHAMTLVRPGGHLVFSNCSLDPCEGEDMVARVLANAPGWSRVPLQPADWPGLKEAISPLGAFRTTPDMLKGEEGFSGGLDGFYAVLLQKG